jgi:RNA polymerase sigma-70 factor (ECF subfamily)
MRALPAAILSTAPDAATDAGARLAALFDAHADRLYRLARRLAPTTADAGDLVQETFLRAARSLARVPTGFCREEAWLVRVLVNIRRDQWRALAVKRRTLAALRGAADRSDDRVEAALIARRIVWRALDVLSPRRRTIVVLHELEGMALPAIAALLGVSEITVRWHLSMARRDLRRLLAAHVGDIG